MSLAQPAHEEEDKNDRQRNADEPKQSAFKHVSLPCNSCWDNELDCSGFPQSLSFAEAVESRAPDLSKPHAKALDQPCSMSV
jgi:hypothetical protein